MSAVLVALAAGALVLAALPPGPARVPVPPAPHGAPLGTFARGSQLLAERLVPSLRARRRDRQLPGLLDRLASALRAGYALGPALLAGARDHPTPLADDLRPTVRALERGTPLAEALRMWAASGPPAPDVELVVAALTVGAGAGGEVARAIDGVAATLRERHEVRAELRALATQAEASAALLAAAPIGFALLVASIEPGAVGFLLTTPVGLGCLAAGLLLDLAGLAWMARITTSAT